MIPSQVAQVFLIYWITISGYIIWLLKTRSKKTRDIRRTNLE
jgi:hypothetical protein